MYYFIERSIAIIKPKLPFLNWVNTTFDDLTPKLTMDTIRIDCNSYVIPEVDEIEDGINFIDGKFADLFVMELSSWTDDESLWPKDISLKMFWEWFDIEIYPTAIDLTENEHSHHSHEPKKIIESTIH